MIQSPLEIRSIASEIALMYDEAETALLLKLAKQFRSIDLDTITGWRKRLIDQNAEIKAAAQNIYDELTDETQKEISQIFYEAYTMGYSSDIDFDKIKGLVPAGFTSNMLRLVTETQLTVGSMLNPILRQVDDFYRQAQSESIIKSFVNGQTRLQTTQNMLNQLADKGISCFIDKSDRQWDGASYAEMAVRTGAMHAYREGFVDYQVMSGNILVYVSSHAGACPLCIPWEHRILRIGDAVERKKEVEKVGLKAYNDTELTGSEESALNQYISSDAYKINSKLRSGEALTTDDQAFVRQLDSALDKLPAYEGTAYRSLSDFGIDDVGSFIKSYVPGAYIPSPAYTSSSLAVYDDSMPIQYVIKSKTGRNITSYNAREQEILFKRDTTFMVTKVKGNIIYLEET